jgi:AraC family transcriptional regulator
MNAEIDVKQMPAIDVAYISHVGLFDQIGTAYKKLMLWAAFHGQYGRKTITCYHDNPEITDIDKLRQSACIEIAKPVKKSNRVNFTTIKEGNYAVGKFEIPFSEFEKAWQGVMVWVSEKGYIVDSEKVCYEIYHNNFKTHPNKKCEIEICVPVKSEEL